MALLKMERIKNLAAHGRATAAATVAEAAGCCCAATGTAVIILFILFAGQKTLFERGDATTDATRRGAHNTRCRTRRCSSCRTAAAGNASDGCC